MLVQPHNASAQVAGAIRQAANSTGASFDYLLATAQLESNFNPAAQASTSSAHGLYQFIDQTWLATMKEAGPSLGYGTFAANITRGADGRYEVADANARNAIMALRSNAKVSAMMAGAYAKNNAAALTDGLGRAPSEGELYIAHFLGSDGASRLISAAVNQPDSRAASIFPQAAASNRPIFYDKSGHARSAIDVYRVLTGRYETARMNTAAMPVVAETTPLRGSFSAAAPAAAAPRAPDVATAVSRIPDTAGVTKAYADAAAQTQTMAYAAPQPAPPAREAEPFFQSMFSSGPRQGVGPMVRGLWTTPTATDTGSRPVNLFSDIEPPQRKGGKNGV
jgi:hypothetical protein